MTISYKEVYQEELLKSTDFNMIQVHDGNNYIGHVIVKGIGTISVLDIS